jgi:protein-disulfide isomerase
MEHLEQENKTEAFLKNQLTTPIAIVVAGLLIAGALLIKSTPTQPTAQKTVPVPNQPAQQVTTGGQPQPPAPSVDISNVKTTGNPFVGNPSAPVTIAYWSDYQCPFCKRLEEESITQLMSEYVKTGKVKIVFKDFQFLGPDSQTAGLAARAVWDIAPDKFYEWHKAMYDKQDSENSGWGNKTDILALTKSLGIDSVKVQSLMTSKASEYQKAMDADKAEGDSYGIGGTPGIIIGKNLVSGAQPYSTIKQLVDLALIQK